MIQINGLEKSYKSGTEEVEVLKHVSLTVEDHSYVSIVGPSGSGKSTLLHTIGGLEPIDRGEIWVNKNAVHKLKDKQLAKLRLNEIGYIFQQFHLLPTATALENVMMPLLNVFSSKDIKEKAKESLERVGLGHRIDHLPSRLSGGEQQRVAIARALVTKPSIILADEPTGNLDSETGRKIMHILEDIHVNDGVTIVLITHDESIAKRASRRVHLLDGKVEVETLSKL
ncbi:ABC transporter ATP-binding protein [Alkalibacillus haloalkaliphilus]|uniref:ABC transporter ATP-binding protein n=1 Tax=Alkalibacillus haloalkaliphilus TaxID=94136 RepID=UPI0029367688|nr:ABC transporter ATP-binding protein [Alkalibacillus haloalkaliphilus]MDV2580575.1 ABC transporter ATP-binding protein [Alkalibacillus haloalkaliphilus]